MNPTPDSSIKGKINDIPGGQGTSVTQRRKNYQISLMILKCPFFVALNQCRWNSGGKAYCITVFLNYCNVSFPSLEENLNSFTKDWNKTLTWSTVVLFTRNSLYKCWLDEYQMTETNNEWKRKCEWQGSLRHAFLYLQCKMNGYIHIWLLQVIFQAQILCAMKLIFCWLVQQLSFHQHLKKGKIV